MVKISERNKKPGNDTDYSHTLRMQLQPTVHCFLWERVWGPKCSSKSCPLNMWNAAVSLLLLDWTKPKEKMSLYVPWQN